MSEGISFISVIYLLYGIAICHISSTHRHACMQRTACVSTYVYGASLTLSAVLSDMQGGDEVENIEPARDDDTAVMNDDSLPNITGCVHACQ